MTQLKDLLPSKVIETIGDLETEIVDKLCYCIERHDVSESLNILKDSYYNGVNMEVLLKRKKACFVITQPILCLRKLFLE